MDDGNKEKKVKIGLIFYIILVFIWNLLYILPPFLVHFGHENQALTLYHLFSPLCHQWPYRSFCLYFNPFHIDACAYKNETALIQGRFFNTFTSHVSTFNKANIGYERNYIIITNRGVGYKFAVCERCTGFYVGMLLIGLAFLSKRFADLVKGSIIKQALIATLLWSPLIITGLIQLLTHYETPHILRFLTGLFAGFGSGYIIIITL